MPIPFGLHLRGETMTNLWHFVIQVVFGSLYGLSIGLGILPPHQQWGLAAAVVSYGAELLTICFVFLGSFIRFRTLFFILSLIFAMELWRRKGKLLNIIALVRFFL